MPLVAFDHGLAALYFVALPAYGFATRHHLARAVAAGEPGARLREYREILVLLGSGTLLLSGWWISAERPAELLRLGMPLTGAALTSVLASLFAAGVLVRQLVLARREPERLRSVLEQLRGVAGVEPLIPRSEPERRLYRWVSLAAGVGEELIFRGFGLWYVSQLVSPWLAVVITAIVFAAGHAYQGFGGVLRTGALAVGFGAAAVASDTILPLIALHTLVDLVNGELVSLALDLRDREAACAAGAERAPRTDDGH